MPLRFDIESGQFVEIDGKKDDAPIVAMAQAMGGLIKGDKGDNGERGEKGEKGEKGDTGERGEKGDTGKDGRNGLIGKDGVDGLDGIDGFNGKDGIGIGYRWDGTKLGIKRENEVEYVFVDLKGKDGIGGLSGGGTRKIKDLRDVLITDITNGQSIVYQDGNWVNSANSPNLTGDILATYTIDNSANVTGVLNYGGGGNWIAGGYDNALKVYAYKTVAGLGRVYSPTPAQSITYTDNNLSQDILFEWEWDVVTGATGYIILRYTNDPAFAAGLGYNYNYFVDVTGATIYSDYGDEWGLLNFTLNATLTQYDTASSVNGDLHFIPNRSADSSAIAPIFKIGAGDTQQQRLNYQNGRWEFLAADNTRGTLYANISAASITAASANITSLSGTFTGTVNQGLTANKIAIWNSSNNLSYSNSFFHATDGNGFGVSIGDGGGTISGAYKLWLNKSAVDSVYLLFTNGVTGNANTDGFAFGVDTAGAVLFNNRENTAYKWYQNGVAGGPSFVMILNSTGELTVGGSQALGSTGAQFYVQAKTTGAIAQITRGALSGTVDVHQWFDGSGNIGTKINKNAAIVARAGSITALTAPLYYQSGALMTTAEVGAQEFLTDKYYGTITTGAARKEFTLNDIALTSGRIPFNTTNGRLTDSSAFTFSGGTVTATAFSGSGASLTSLNAANISSGTLPILRGGTGQSSFSAGAIVTSGSTISSVSGTTTQYLRGGSSGAPSFAQVQYTDINMGSSQVPAANGGTGLSSYTVGDMIYASATTTLAKLADVAVGAVLVSGGTNTAPSWSNAPTIAGRLTTQSGRNVKARVVTAAGAVTVATSDYVVEVNKTVGAATAVNLPASPTTGDMYFIKDGKRDASTNNITITPAAGNIEGAANYVMNTNGQSAQIYYSGTEWKVI